MEEYPKSNQLEKKQDNQVLAGGVEIERVKKTPGKFLFKIGVPSRSEPGVIRIVEVYGNGKMICSCPARPSIFCHHRKTILQRLDRLVKDIKALNHFSKNG